MDYDYEYEAGNLALANHKPRAQFLLFMLLLLYSRTSLTRGFWEEINRAKKPRTVEVPRVREVSYLSPIFWCYVSTCTNTSIQLPYLDVSRFFKLIFIILLLPDLI